MCVFVCVCVCVKEREKIVKLIICEILLPNFLQEVSGSDVIAGAIGSFDIRYNFVLKRGKRVLRS